MEKNNHQSSTGVHLENAVTHTLTPPTTPSHSPTTLHPLVPKQMRPLTPATHLSASSFQLRLALPPLPIGTQFANVPKLQKRYNDIVART